MRRITHAQIFKGILIAILVNGIFYSYYWIAVIQLHWPPFFFTIGCILLALMLVKILHGWCRA